MAIEFNENHKDMMVAALAEHLGMTGRRRQNRFMHSIEKTGSVYEFVVPGQAGVPCSFKQSTICEQGGLTGQFEDNALPVSVWNNMAVLEGFSRDFVVFDAIDRGTEQKPAIRMGLEAEEDAKTHGFVLETSLADMTVNAATGYVVHHIQKLGERVRPGDKIDLANISAVDGRIIRALVSVADVGSDLYVYNPKNRFARKDGRYGIEPGDVRGRASIVGAAFNAGNGDNKPCGAITNLDSLRDMIEDAISGGYPVEKCLVDLYVVAMNTRLEAYIEDDMGAYERDGDLANSQPARISVHNRACDHNMNLKRRAAPIEIETDVVVDVSETAQLSEIDGATPS